MTERHDLEKGGRELIGSLSRQYMDKHFIPFRRSEEELLQDLFKGSRGGDIRPVIELSRSLLDRYTTVLPGPDLQSGLLPRDLHAGLREWNAVETAVINNDVLASLQPANFTQRLWIRTRRTGLKAQEIYTGALNGLRRLFRKEVPQPETAVRSFNYSAWAEYLISDFLYRELLIMLPRLNHEFTKRQLEHLKKISALMDGELMPEGSEAKMEEPAALSGQLFSDLENSGGYYSEFADAAVAEILEKWGSRVGELERIRSFAGGWGYRSSLYSAKRLSRLRRKMTRKLSRIQEDWNEYRAAEREEWKKKLELTLVQSLIGKGLDEFSLGIRTKIEKRIMPAFSGGINLVEKLHSRLTREEVQPEDWDGIRESLLKELRNRELPRILNILLEESFESDLASFTAAGEAAFQIVSGEHIIARTEVDRHHRPQVKTDRIQLAELMRDDIQSGLNRELTGMEGRHRKVQEQIFRDISELDQIIEYNFNSGMSILEGGERQEALKNILEGLQRSSRQISDIPEFISSRYSALLMDLEGLIASVQEKIRYLGDTEKIMEIRLRWGRARTRRKVLERIRSISDHIRRLGPGILDWLLKGRERTLTLIGKFRKVTGLNTHDFNEEARYVRKVVSYEKALGDLPYIYRQLFRSTAVEDRRFLMGREKEMKNLRKVFRDYNDGILNKAVLTGETGSGRSTLMNFIADEIASQMPVHRIEIGDHISSPEELFQVIASAIPGSEIRTKEDLLALPSSFRDRQAFLFDNTHFMFSRSRGGFELLALLEAFMKAGPEHFFFFSSGIYAWDYLKRIHRFPAPFREIRIGLLSREEIEAIILKRHRITGYELEFNIPADRKIQKVAVGEKQQDAIRQYFFNNINDLCAGNIMVAMTLWLSSISGTDNDTVHIEPDILFDSGWLYRLSPEYQFTLYTVLLHHRAGVPLLAKILNMSPERCAAVIGHLRELKLLQGGDSGLSIHPYIYRQVVDMLKVKNIIH